MTEIGHHQEQMYLNNNREQALMQDCLCVFKKADFIWSQF